MIPQRCATKLTRLRLWRVPSSATWETRVSQAHAFADLVPYREVSFLVAAYPCTSTRCPAACALHSYSSPRAQLVTRPRALQRWPPVQTLGIGCKRRGFRRTRPPDCAAASPAAVLVPAQAAVSKVRCQLPARTRHCGAALLTSGGAPLLPQRARWHSSSGERARKATVEFINAASGRPARMWTTDRTLRQSACFCMRVSFCAGHE